MKQKELLNVLTKNVIFKYEGDCVQINLSYTKEFEKLISNMRKKYPEELFELEGIGSQLDISKFSKKFFNSKVNSDSSIDANANVDDTSVIAYDIEMAKPYQKLNSYYVLWKKLKKLFDLDTANKIIEHQISGDIYINDMHGIGSGKPYSYYEKTVLVMKIDDEIIYTTISDFYNILKEKGYDLFESEDCNQINLKNVKVLDCNNEWVNVSRILKHKSHARLIGLETKNGKCTSVTTDHPIILDDKEIYACDINIGDKIKISNSKIPISEKIKIDNDYAYFVGFLVGDGLIIARKGKRVEINSGRLSIFQKEIENTKIYNITNKLFDNVRIVKDGRAIEFGRKKDVEKLLDTGIRSENRKLPNNILNWNKDAIKSCIAGIIDSDGNINTNGICSIRVTSYELVQQIGELVDALNIGKYRTSFCGRFESKSGYKSNKDIYRISIRITDKDFIKYSEKIKNKADLVYKKIGKDGRFETNELYKKIDMGMPEYVYDITTNSGHFHCQGMIQHNCFNYSTYDILMNGLPMVKKIKSYPPKYLYSFKSQLEQFIIIASNSTLGATGVADILVTMSHYIENIFKNGHDAGFYFDGWFSDEEKKLIEDELLKLNEFDKNIEIEEIEKITNKINNKLNKKEPYNKKWFESNVYRYAKENIVSFIYTINQPLRGQQSAFTNVSIYDDYFLDKICNDYIYPDGTMPNKEIIKKLQEIYLNTMNKEMERTPITFPVTTACFSIDKENNIQDETFLNFIAKENKKYGFINIYSGDSSTLSSCCRLRSEQKSEYFNSFGSGSSKIGSLGVCTINLPRLAIKSNSEDEFIENLRYFVGVCAKVNKAKREVVKSKIKNGNHPLYTYEFMDITKQYSTVGVSGFNEAIMFLGKNILNKDGTELGLKIINTINDENKKYEKEYDAPHNCEQIPAETASVKIAKKDIILGYQNNIELYSNQFIPLTTEADLLDRIKLQGIFDKHFTGGAILHLNCENKIDDEKLIANLIKVTAKMGVVYHSINYVLNECEDGHMTIGINDVCDICGKKIINKYTRVVGFLTNVKNWNKVRRDKDFPNRKFYKGVKL